MSCSEHLKRCSVERQEEAVIISLSFMREQRPRYLVIFPESHGSVWKDWGLSLVCRSGPILRSFVFYPWCHQWVPSTRNCSEQRRKALFLETRCSLVHCNESVIAIDYLSFQGNHREWKSHSLTYQATWLVFCWCWTYCHISLPFCIPLFLTRADSKQVIVFCYRLIICGQQ